MVAVNSVWGQMKTCFSWTVTYIATPGCGSAAEAASSKHTDGRYERHCVFFILEAPALFFYSQERFNFKAFV